MLEFYVNNNRVSLPEDFKVSLTYEDPLLLVDKIPGQYVISGDLPLDSVNRMIFLNPDRPTSSAALTEFKYNLYFDSIEVSNGKLYVSFHNGKIKFKSQSYYLPDILRESINKLNLGSPALPVDPIKKYPEVNVAMAPIRLGYKEWFAWKFYNGAYNAKRMFLNFWNIDDQAFKFLGYKEFINFATSIVWGDNWKPSQAATLQDMTYSPAIYVCYLLDVIFGDKLKSNPFKEDPELKTLVVGSSNTSDNYQHLGNFFSNEQKINIFLKDLLKTFCMTLFVKADGYYIKRNKDVLANSSSENWEEFITEVNEIAKEEGKGYSISFHNSEEKEEVDNKTTLVKDLHTVKRDEYYVTTTNNKFSIDHDENAHYGRRIKQELNGLTPYKSGENCFNVTTEKLAPLPMSFEYVWSKDFTRDEAPDVALDHYLHLYSDYFEKLKEWNDAGGSLSDKPDKPDGYSIPEVHCHFYKYSIYCPILKEEGESLYLMFNRGLRFCSFENTMKYPMFDNHNIDSKGVSTGNYSLHPDELHKNFHKETAEYISKDKRTLKAKRTLTALQLRNLDLESHKYYQGMKYRLKKMQVTLEMDRIREASCEFLEVKY